MEFLPSELLINIIDNIWNLDTLIQLQQTNKLLYDCVNSSYSFNKFKECMNDRRWNHSYMPKLKEGKIYVIGCIKGILEIVREYSKEVDRDIILTGFRETAENGHLEILKWLKETFNITEKDAKTNYNEAFRQAARYGNLEVLKWLKETFNITNEEAKIKSNFAFRYAAQNGHLHVLIWLKETFDITEKQAKIFNNFAFRLAAENGHLHILKWLKENFNITKEDAKSNKKYTFREAQYNHHIDVLEWLTCNFNIR
jgi:hypothetical protein